MSSIGDAFSGTTSGTTDTSGLDVNSMFGNLPNNAFDATGGGDVSNLGGGGFNSFSDLANALSGGGYGGSPNAAQSIAMTPPSAAATSGGDPTGAASGTQSATSPGSQPAQPQGGGGGQQNQQQGQHAPPQAVDQLRTLLKQLAGAKPQGPTGMMQRAGAIPTPPALPTLSAGQTGPQSTGSFYGTPVQPMAPLDAAASIPAQVAGSQPAGASLEQGGTPPPAGTEPGGSRDIPADTSVNRDTQGNPVTAAGTPAAQTPTPSPRPTGDQTASTTGGAPTPKTDDQGRQITVQKPVARAQPPQTADLPTRVPHPDQTKLPTHKGGPEPAPTPYPATTQIQRDIAGVSTGSPTALADLAHAAMALAPLIGMFMGGGRRGHFRRGGFQGMRGFRPFGARGGFHYGGARPWPYHHPIHGWDMHHMHPGGGWLPMSPQDGASFGLNPQQDPNAPDPNNPPKETGTPNVNAGGDGGSTDAGGIAHSDNPLVAALLGMESGGKNIVSQTDKDDAGRTLAQGGDPNQISQGYFQIRPSTWRKYAQQAGVNPNILPRQASYADQWKVASVIPFGQWGGRTKFALERRFGALDQHATLGQVASRFGGTNVAQAPRTVAPKHSPPNTVPVTSQPMVAGQ